MLRASLKKIKEDLAKCKEDIIACMVSNIVDQNGDGSLCQLLTYNQRKHLKHA